MNKIKYPVLLQTHKRFQTYLIGKDNYEIFPKLNHKHMVYYLENHTLPMCVRGKVCPFYELYAVFPKKDREEYNKVITPVFDFFDLIFRTII